MKIDVAAVRKSLKSFDFQTLFREHLGWDNYQAQLDIPINGTTVRLKALAEKRGFVAFLCPSIPDRPTRLKIDHQVTKSAREHFVIYADQSAGQQVWQWVRREPGKPLASRDHRFDANQSGDPLIQRLEQIAVSLDEEEKITVVDVAGRARAAFDVDKVTKKFYDRFKTEHAAFLKLIKGIKADADLQWYTSLMLNRLMFVYFIQKKGFLDGDIDYLRNRLALVRQVKGKDKFQSFYRYFLLRLFHDGLGKSPEDRKLDTAMEKLLGKVPYLNGGFFEEHDLERKYLEIDIPDTAFEKLFDFFDLYSWHLDERPLRLDNEINPDVVGYIFEKYINQKQMGAYYTKEDITEYISKNTIIPFLFDAAQKKCAIAFQPDSALWRLLRDDPDRYIYPAVRHGVVDDNGNIIPLPKQIEAGIKDVAKRDGWNKTADDPFGLPTETWREHIARRQRCLDIRAKLGNGEVHQINDLITLNLDLWQFARDAIVNAEGPELLRAFWHALQSLTVLDPTCGSGAFLFAALRILETLYDDCLERMERFIEDAQYAALQTPQEQISALIAAGESATVEFKSTARWDVKENKHNPLMEEVIVKTVAGFLNAHGGCLLIGVDDAGKLLGLEQDFLHTKKNNPNRDQFELWLNKHLSNQLGKAAIPCFHVDFAHIDGHEVCRISVSRAAKPVYVEKKGQEVLYVRQGNATDPYTKPSEVSDYIQQHWTANQPVPAPPSPPSPYAPASPKPAGKAKPTYDDLRQVLKQIDQHPSHAYFTLKSIIINNLFGVDIMEEAVEICKLRLFLKLVAQVETVSQIEPLPDIDFNIRAGNTLVGYATLDQVRIAVEGGLGENKAFDFGSEVPHIEAEAAAVDLIFRKFREMQTAVAPGSKQVAQTKLAMRQALTRLSDRLDQFLAIEYGIKIEKPKTFEVWKSSHEPFHWFVEFYGIMKLGGFDVVIGNPPYLESRQIDYSPRSFATHDSGAVHAMCIERSISLLQPAGTTSMIVPLALVSTQRMTAVQQLLENSSSTWYANFAWRPGKLFDTVNRALTIYLVCRGRGAQSFSTNYQKWNSETRCDLIPTTSYCSIPRDRGDFWAPKLGSKVEERILSKLQKTKKRMSDYMGRSANKIYYRTTGGLYWKVFTDFAPEFKCNGKRGHSSRETSMNMAQSNYIKPAIALLSSNLFWWWYTITSNLRDLNPSDIQGFPVPDGVLEDKQIGALGAKYLKDLQANSTMLIRQQKQTGKTETQSFKIQQSKPILDEIDAALANHYGLTPEELDFVINYDIKYRMGGAEVDGGDDE